MMRSRRARSVRSARGGWPLVFCRRRRNLPSLPAALASLAAEVISPSDIPARSALLSTRTAPSLISLRTFWVNVVWSVASSALKAFSLVLSASLSLAPARTKSL